MIYRKIVRTVFRAVIVFILSSMLLPIVPAKIVEAQSVPLDDISLTTILFFAPTPTPLLGTTISINLDPVSVAAGVDTPVTVSGRLTRTDTGAGVNDRLVKLDWPTGNMNVAIDSNGYYSYTLAVSTTQNWVFQITFSGDVTYSECWNSKILTVEATSTITRPTLQGWKVSKTDPKPGEIITISYGLNNLTGGTATVGLGATIRQSGTIEEIIDSTRDKIVTLASGFGWYTRDFQMPDSDTGFYDIYLILWSGQPEESTWVDGTGWLLQQLLVPLPEFQVSLLTVSPPSGDTSTEFVFSVTVEGGSSSYTVQLLDPSSQDLEPAQSGSSSTFTFKRSFPTPGSYSAYALVNDTAANRAETNGVSVSVSPVAIKKPEIREFTVPGGPVKPGDKLSLQMGIKNIETGERKFSVRLAVSIHTSATADMRIWEDFEIYNALVLFKAGEVKQIPVKWTVPESIWPGACGVKLQVYDEAENLLVKLEKLSPVVDTNLSYVELDGTYAMRLMHIHFNNNDMKALRTTGTGQDFSANKEDVINLLRQTRIIAQPELKFFLDTFAESTQDTSNPFIPAYSLTDGSGGLSVIYYPQTGRVELFGASPAQIIEEYKGRNIGDILNLLSEPWWESAIKSLVKTPGKLATKSQYGIRLSTYYAVFYTGAVAYLSPETLKRVRGEQFSISLNIDPKDRGVSSGEVRISFDPDALEVRDIVPGALMGSAAVVGKKVVDNGSGSAVLSLARGGPTAPPTNADLFVSVLFAVRPDAKAGRYQISISAISLADENGRDISRIETRQAIITLGGKTGDADVNGIVDARDLAILRAAYGTSKNQPGFDPAADFNNDGLIDYKDLAILGANYEG